MSALPSPRYTKYIIIPKLLRITINFLSLALELLYFSSSYEQNYHFSSSQIAIFTCSAPFTSFFYDYSLCLFFKIEHCKVMGNIFVFFFISASSSNHPYRHDIVICIHSRHRFPHIYNCTFSSWNRCFIQKSKWLYKFCTRTCRTLNFNRMQHTITFYDKVNLVAVFISIMPLSE